MTIRTPRVGNHVLVMVPRSTNAGLDHAPAQITRVLPDGKVNVHALVDVGNPVRVTGVQLVADRAAAIAILEAHRKHLPGGKHEENDDGELVQAPGVGPDGKPWNRSDVAHWVKVAYWDTDDAAPAPAPVDDMPAAESRDELVARLERELSAARAAE